jgi:hypothetical protein
MQHDAAVREIPRFVTELPRRRAWVRILAWADSRLCGEDFIAQRETNQEYLAKNVVLIDDSYHCVLCRQ